MKARRFLSRSPNEIRGPTVYYEFIKAIYERSSGPKTHDTTSVLVAEVDT